MTVAGDDHAPLPPQDLDAEESILGAMMMQRQAVEACAELLTRRDFYRASHGELFEAMCRIHDEGEAVDAITVSGRLEQDGALERVGGRVRIYELASIVPAAGNVVWYAKRVRQHAIRRNLSNAGFQIQDLGVNGTGPAEDLVEGAEKIMFDVSRARSSSDFVTIGELMPETFETLERLHAEGREVVGLPTGFGPFDGLTLGLHPSTLNVVAGRPSMGKSALALAIVRNVAVKQRKPVALFTAEMSRREVVQRVLSSLAYVEATKLKNGRIDGEEWRRLYAAQNELDTAPLLIEDSTDVSVGEIRSKSRRAKMRHPDLALVVIDYMQLLTSGTRTSNRVEEVGVISRSLKVLAGDLDVPVLAVSQLSRGVESRHDKRPLLSDLRESGSIEQDADLVALLYRDEYYNPEDAVEEGTEGVAELDVAKHRSGPTGMVKLAFVKKFATFSELA